MMTEKSPIYVSFVLALSLVVAACGGAAGGGQEPGTEAPVKVAYLDSFSGPFVFSGTHGLNGATLAVEQANDAGGVLGRQVELLSADDQGSPEEGVAAFRELAADESLVAVAGITNSGVAAAVSDAALEAQIPLVLKGSYARFLTEEAGHRYIFRVSAGGRTLAWATAQAAPSDFQTVCTIANDFAYGHDITGISLEYLRQINPDLELLPGCEFWPTLDESDMTPYISAIASAGPDLIIFSGLPAAAGPFIRQGQAAGLFDSVAAAINATGGSLEELESLQETEVPPNMIVGSDFPYPVDEDAMGFYNAYTERFGGEQPDSSSAIAYTAIKTVLAAIEAAGSTDREAVIDALKGITVEYPTGNTATLRAFDHQSDVGWWMGDLAWDADAGASVMANLQYIEVDGVLPTESEIDAMRSE
jgi:branched-chain amino acid transport system substrate-binding protein